MLDEQQEWRLVQGLRDGRTDAWQALYDAYAERVWRTVARLLGPACSDVGDVVQETILAAARSARGYDPERGSLWLWLAGIARNQAVLHLRRHGQRQRLVQAAAGNGHVLRWLDGAEASPPGALLSAELAALVRATLGTLPEDYSMLLSARYLDGETVADIARRDRSTETAVRSKLARARQAFRAAFGPHEQDFTQRPAEAHHEPPR